VEKFFDEVAQGKFFVVGKVAQGNTVMDIRDSSRRRMKRPGGIILSCANMIL
jgi:hypothetical protein